MLNLTKNSDSRVDIVTTQHAELLYIKFVRDDKDTGTSTFEIALDPVDLEHFIATLITLAG